MRGVCFLVSSWVIDLVRSLWLLYFPKNHVLLKGQPSSGGLSSCRTDTAPNSDPLDFYFHISRIEH